MEGNIDELKGPYELEQKICGTVSDDTHSEGHTSDESMEDHGENYTQG